MISKEKEIETQETYKKALLEELVMRHRHKTSDITNDSITINANDPSQNSEVVLSVEQSRILAAKVMEVMSQTDVISDPDFIFISTSISIFIIRCMGLHVYCP